MAQPSPVISISSSSPTPSPSPIRPTRRRLFQPHPRSPISISSSSSSSTSPCFVPPAITSQPLSNTTARNLFLSRSPTPSPTTSTTTPSSSAERLRQRFLDAAHRRAWLSAPGAYNFSRTAYKAYINNNLPSSPSSHNTNHSSSQSSSSQDVFVITDTSSPTPIPTVSTPSDPNLISTQIDTLAATLGRQVRLTPHSHKQFHTSTSSPKNNCSSNHTTTSSSQLQTLVRPPSLPTIGLPNPRREVRVTSTPDTCAWLPGGDFRQVREEAARRLLRYYDRCALEGVLGTEERELHGDRVTVGWSKRLYKTAGVTYLRTCRKSGRRTAEIVLSEKVVDEVDRLYRTLAHEMCHAAMWIVDEVVKPPHGKLFRKWVQVFESFDNDLQITTTHDYSIRFRFYYECTKCAQRYGRHSRSIDTKKKVCGVCAGSLVLLE